MNDVGTTEHRLHYRKLALSQARAHTHARTHSNPELSHTASCNEGLKLIWDETIRWQRVTWWPELSSSASFFFSFPSTPGSAAICLKRLCQKKKRFARLIVIQPKRWCASRSRSLIGEIKAARVDGGRDVHKICMVRSGGARDLHRDDLTLAVKSFEDGIKVATLHFVTSDNLACRTDCWDCGVSF